MDVLKNIARLNSICSDITWIRGKKNKFISLSSSVDLRLVILRLPQVQVEFNLFSVSGKPTSQAP